jgi:mannitol-specific phosphotransferase system IIBC component
MPDETPEERIERIRQDAAIIKQRNNQSFWMTIFNTVFGVVNTIIISVLLPLLIRSYHLETVQKVEATNAQVSEVKQEAAAAKLTAADTNKAVKTEVTKLDKKADANLTLWDAYHNGDMNKAAEVLARVEKQ